MNVSKDNYLISTDKSLLCIDDIHRFLSHKAYWCLGIPKEVVSKAIENSLCFGLFDETSKKQVGFARVVTDKATFAWICDVYIEEAYRGRSLSKWLMEVLLSHPDLLSLRRVCLATKDAHDLYKMYGFKVTETPQNWMEVKDNDIYKNMNLGKSAT